MTKILDGEGKDFIITEGLCEFRSSRSFARGYLETYYGEAPTNDERVVLSFLVRHLPCIQGVTSFLDVGCGPTLHHVLPVAPYVGELILSDYLDENLAEVEAWRQNASDAHPWSLFTKHILELEGKPADARDILHRETETRNKITSLAHCDLRRRPVIAGNRRFPAVGAFYCTEEVGVTLAAWETVMSNLADLVAPDGWLFLACLRGSEFYLVDHPEEGERHYPSAYLSEEDVLRVLPRLGFAPDRMVMESIDVGDQAHHGCTGVILVRAQKDPS